MSETQDAYEGSGFEFGDSMHGVVERPDRKLVLPTGEVVNAKGLSSEVLERGRGILQALVEKLGFKDSGQGK